MRYYLIAGEASGDLHASKIISGIKENDPNAEFRFWGGDKMCEADFSENLVRHYKEAAFMGFWEVFRNIRTILGQMSHCKSDIVQWRPDVVILVDYAGFNLRIARFAKSKGFRTFFYIAPKVWAWKESRIKKIQKYVDELFVIFPFEVEYFKRWGINAHYFGNPIMDSIEQRNKELSTQDTFTKENGLDDRPIISLVAGSRKNEIDYNLPFMVEVASRFKEYQFVVTAVPWLEKSLYMKYIENTENVKYVCDKTYDLIAHSTAAIVTSGTATLETALLKTPEFVCYWCNPVSAFIGRMFLKIKYVSLVNIVMEREVIKEFLYKDMKVDNACMQLMRIIPEGEDYSLLMEDYEKLATKMGDSGASMRVARKMTELLQ